MITTLLTTTLAVMITYGVDEKVQACPGDVVTILWSDMYNIHESVTSECGGYEKHSYETAGSIRHFRNLVAPPGKSRYFHDVTCKVRLEVSCPTLTCAEIKDVYEEHCCNTSTTPSLPNRFTAQQLTSNGNFCAQMKTTYKQGQCCHGAVELSWGPSKINLEELVGKTYLLQPARFRMTFEFDDGQVYLVERTPLGEMYLRFPVYTYGDRFLKLGEAELNPEYRTNITITQTLDFGGLLDSPLQGLSRILSTLSNEMNTTSWPLMDHLDLDFVYLTPDQTEIRYVIADYEIRDNSGKRRYLSEESMETFETLMGFWYMTLETVTPSSLPVVYPNSLFIKLTHNRESGSWDYQPL